MTIPNIVDWLPSERSGDVQPGLAGLAKELVHFGLLWVNLLLFNLFSLVIVGRRAWPSHGCVLSHVVAIRVLRGRDSSLKLITIPCTFF